MRRAKSVTERLNPEYPQTSETSFHSELRIYDLRHTLGTWMSARGKDNKLTKEVLGHADITSTQRYLHVGVDRRREALNETLRFDLSAPRE